MHMHVDCESIEPAATLKIIIHFKFSSPKPFVVQGICTILSSDWRPTGYVSCDLFNYFCLVKFGGVFSIFTFPFCS